MNNPAYSRSPLLALAVTLATPLAFAQTGAGTSAQAPRLEEVVVTSQRITENLQQVPISVTAINGDALDMRQIDGFDQLQYVVPGLTFGAGINSRQSASTIRGIGTSLFNIGIEGSVAMAVDGIILGREGAGLFDLSDVERIEVLRGPQGTLFGKNASAGVIAIKTRRPTDEFGGHIGVSYGSYDELSVNGAVSGPLSDSVNGRLSGYTNKRDGYITNVNPSAPERELNERDEYGFRGKLDFAVADNLDILVGVDYAKRDQASGALTLRSGAVGGPGQGLLSTGVPVIGPVTAGAGIEAGPDNRQIASEGAFFSEMESYGGLVEVNWQLGDFDVMSLTGYREWTSLDNNDADLIPLPLLAINSGDLEQDQFSQEIHLVSPRDQRFTYTVGAYYFEQQLSQLNTQAGTAGLDLLGALPPGLLLGTDLDSSIDETNMALFGQGQFELTPQLSLIGGLRVLRSELSGAIERSVTPGTVAPFAGQSVTTEPLTAEVNDNAVAWRLGAQYFLSDDVNLFTTVSRGYKTGGIVSGLTVNATTPGGNQLPTVEPEIPLQYEVGIRSTGWDGRLVSNFTAFYTEIEDFQAQALIPGSGGTTIFSVTNAGTAETWGLEGDVTVMPAAGLTLSVAFAYTNATFDDFQGAPCYQLQAVGPNGCVDTNGDGRGEFQDLTGKDLAQSPDWVVNALARYEFDLSPSLQMFTQVGLNYRDEAVSGNNNDPRTVVDAYTLVDAQLGVNFWEGRGSLTLFGRNLFDEDFVEAIIAQPLDTGGYAQFRTFESIRSVGIRLSLDY